MRIRFLKVTESLHPERPFQVGRIIELDKMTAEARAWIKAGQAEVMKDEPEFAVVATTERAVKR